jgi:hypothetical protein
LSPDGRTIALLNVPADGEPRRGADLVFIDGANGAARVAVRSLAQVPAVWAPDGSEVYVVRSEPVPPPADLMRQGRIEDERLIVLAVGRDGRARAVAEDVAYMLHPIGVSPATDEIVAIRASWQLGSIRAIDPLTGHVRDLATSPLDAFRDVTLDAAGEYAICLRREPAARRAVIERVSLTGQAARVLATVAEDAAPGAAGGAVVFTRDQVELALARAGRIASLWRAPQAHSVRVVAASGTHAMVHEIDQEAGAQRWFVVDLRSGGARRLDLEPTSVLVVAGWRGVAR